MKRKPTATSSQHPSSSVLLDTTGSHPLTSEDSRSESVLVQELLAVQDLDRDRDLLFTNTVLKTMSTLRPGTSITPQERMYNRYQEELARAREQVFELVEAGDLAGLRDLVRRYPLSFDIRSDDGRENTLMHVAAKATSKEIVDFLMKEEQLELINARNASGWTPVTIMIAHQPSLLRHLLQQYSDKVNWKYRDDNGNGYLHYGYFYHLDQELLQELNSRCDPNIQNVFKLVPRHICGQHTPTKDPTGKIRKHYTLDLTTPFKNNLSKKTEESQEDQRHCNSSSPLRRNRMKRFEQPISPVKGSVMSQVKGSITRSTMSLVYRIEDFQLEKLLGKGAFADAYEATHSRSGRVVAVKCIHKNRLSHESMKYVYNEKELLGKLQHPGLVRFYCSFQNEGYLFLVMELCSNDTLRHFLKQPGQLPENYVKLLAAELVEVISYLHENCIIYRDLKPENVGIDSEGHVKLLDLGLSKEARRSNSICGSYHYLAPEMISRGEHSFGLDWYMLGVLLYEMMTGVKPFQGQSPEEILKNISSREIPDVSFASPELQDLIKQLVQKHPEKRIGWREDSAEIKKHPWLATINWERLARRQYNMSVDYFFGKNRETHESREKPVLEPSQATNFEFEHLEGWEFTAEPL